MVSPRCCEDIEIGQIGRAIWAARIPSRTGRFRAIISQFGDSVPYMRTDFIIFLGPPLAAQLRFDNSPEIKYRLGADRHCVVYPGRQVGAEAMESDGGLLTIVNWSGLRGIH